MAGHLRRVLITGANKGLGLASVATVLRQAPDSFVFLGSRDMKRGNDARNRLVTENPEWRERISVVEVDVTNSESVAAAVKTVVYFDSDKESLFGLVNNAGVAKAPTLREMNNVNVYGLKSVFDAFAPRLKRDGGRVINVTGAVGPMYVAKVRNDHWKRVLTNPESWHELQQFLHMCEDISDEGGFREAGLTMNHYGLSKAAANALTILQAREYPTLLVNALTPGFAATDVARDFMNGQDPATKGAKPPSECMVPLQRLLLDIPKPPEGSGQYYGPDGNPTAIDRIVLRKLK